MCEYLSYFSGHLLRGERESLSVSQMFARVGSWCGRLFLPAVVCLYTMRHEAVGSTHLCSGYVCAHMCTGSPWLQRQSWLAHWGLWGVRAVPGPCCNFLSAWQDLPRLGQQRLAVEHATNQGLNLSPHWPACAQHCLPSLMCLWVCARSSVWRQCRWNIMCITQIINPSSCWQSKVVFYKCLMAHTCPVVQCKLPFLIHSLWELSNRHSRGIAGLKSEQN